MSKCIFRGMQALDHTLIGPQYGGKSNLRMKPRIQ